MDVEMWHTLPGGFAIGTHEIDTFIATVVYQVIGDLFTVWIT